MGSNRHFARAPRNAFEVVTVTLRSETATGTSHVRGPCPPHGRPPHLAVFVTDLWVITACYHGVCDGATPEPVPEAPQQKPRCAAPAAYIPTTTCLQPRARKSQHDRRPLELADHGQGSRGRTRPATRRQTQTPLMRRCSEGTVAATSKLETPATSVWSESFPKTSLEPSLDTSSGLIHHKRSRTPPGRGLEAAPIARTREAQQKATTFPL
jgi:hypothetical protein